MKVAACAILACVAAAYIYTACLRLDGTAERPGNSDVCDVHDNRSIEFAKALIASETPRISANCDDFISSVMLVYNKSDFYVFVQGCPGWDRVTIEYDGRRDRVFKKNYKDQELIRIFVEQYNLDAVREQSADEADAAMNAVIANQRANPRVAGVTP